MSWETERGSAPAAEPASESAGRRRPAARRGWGKWLFGMVLLAGLAGLVALVWPQVVAFTTTPQQEGPITHTVTRGPLVITVNEDGNVESASNIEIKCRVKGGSSILWIVEDGKEVEEGELLVRLDRSKSEDELSAQEITLEKAKASKIQAEEEFEVAKIAVDEYLNGTFVKEQQDLEAQIVIAMENLRSAENLLEHTQRMAKKGFVTPLQLEADQFAVQRAQLELESAKTAKMVLEKYTKTKTLKDLESQRDTAEAKMRSEQAAYNLEDARKQRLLDQLKHCEITAPQKGMVVYADNSGGRFSQAVQIEEGAAVREQQTIVRLPDLSNMQVKVLVHETKVEQIRPGMPARIDIMGRQRKGSVVSIANQAERASFFSADVKEYETIVRIQGESKSLKPGMSAQVEILVENLEDVLTVPVQAVVELQRKFYCWVDTPEGLQRRLVLLGRTNDKLIEIKDGVTEGERVLLNPRSMVPEASEEKPADKEAEGKDFGPSPVDGKSPGPKQPGAKPGDEGGGPRRSAERGAAQPGPASTQGEPRERGSGEDRRQRRGPPNLMQYDKDGDGKVSREEAPEQMQRFFDRLDGNGDGFIDQAEIDAMRRRRQDGGGSQPDGRKAPGEGP